MPRDQMGRAFTDKTLYNSISGKHMTVMYNVRTDERDYRTTS